MQHTRQWDVEPDLLSEQVVPLDEVISPMLPRPVPVPASFRQQRRLPDRILVAVHQACDLEELQVAANLLSILEVVLVQPGGSLLAHRRAVEGAVAAYERLWHLRRSRTHQPDPTEQPSSFRPAR